MYGPFILQGTGAVSHPLHFQSVTITLERYIVTRAPTSSYSGGDEVVN